MCPVESKYQNDSDTHHHPFKNSQTDLSLTGENDMSLVFLFYLHSTSYNFILIHFHA